MSYRNMLTPWSGGTVPNATTFSALVTLNGGLAFAANSTITVAAAATNTTALTTTTNVADGATSIAEQHTATTDIVSGGFLSQWTSAAVNAFAIQRLASGTWLWGLGTAGAIGINAGLRLSDPNGTILKYATQSVEVNTDVVGVSFHVGNVNILSLIAASLAAATDNNLQNGTTAARWKSTASYQYFGVHQTLTGTGVIAAFNVASGESIQFQATGNVTSLTMTVGTAGQRATLYLKQGVSALNTWPNVIANVKFPGGTFNKTTTASAIDKFDLVCDGTSWFASSQATNLS